jgi:hypothetical protein
MHQSSDYGTIVALRGTIALPSNKDGKRGQDLASPRQAPYRSHCHNKGEAASIPQKKKGEAASIFFSFRPSIDCGKFFYFLYFLKQ